MQKQKTELLFKKVLDEFEHQFSPNPILIQSPGRINLIGDHTDYNDGFVLPAAINLSTIFALKENNTESIRLYSVDLDEKVKFDLNDLQPNKKHWANYFKGAVCETKRAGFEPRGFDVVFGGNIPIGAGLSSSAALEGGIILGMDKLFNFGISRKQMARLGQLTEHNHVGVNCGIMDQFINLHGQLGRVLKLDCRTLEYELYPFSRKDIKIVLCNSMVSHNLADSEYNIRRKQCDEGVRILQNYHPEIKKLRDVSLSLLQENTDELGVTIFRRCKYILEENQRVHQACDDLKKGDFNSFGKRMFKSHQGLKMDYEVSCRELDLLVEIAGNQPGVLGSRMMGGGFGGCTVNLVEEEYVDSFIETISSKYKIETELEAEIYITQISDGAKVL